MSGKTEKNRFNTLVVDPSAGLSGNMFLGCMMELGVDAQKLSGAVSSLPGLEPFEIVTERVFARGISMSRTKVVSKAEAHSRDFGGIEKMIESSGLESAVKETALSIFRLIAEAEGKIHGKKPEQVHFHEVGAVDSIVDIVGAAYCYRALGSPRIYHRPFRLGSGTISIAHGELPVPAPATIEILLGSEAVMTGEAGEIVTPTGAALIRALASPLPGDLVFKPGRVVYSSGTRDYGKGPGFLRIIAAEVPPERKSVAVLRTTVDDMNPEILAYTRESLFALGAHEVYFSGIVMKKGRPGVEVTVISPEEKIDEMIEKIFLETTTLGIRVAREERIELKRWIEPATTPFGKIDIKFREIPGSTVAFSPEYESCREAAEKNEVPIEAVYREALKAGEKAASESRKYAPGGDGESGPVE